MPKKYGLGQRIKVWLFGSYKESKVDEQIYPENSIGCANCEIRSLFLSELKKHYRYAPKEHTETPTPILTPEQEYLNLLSQKP